MTWCSRSVPGLGSLTLALLEVGARVVAIEIDERLATRLPVTVAEHAPRGARPARRRHGRRAARHRGPRAAADHPGRQPPVQRLRPGPAAPPHAAALARARSRHGAGRGGRPARRRPGLEGLRHPVGQGRLVRRRTPRGHRRPPRVLARAQRRLRPGRLGSAATRPSPPRPASRCSRSSTRRSPSAARVCAARCVGWPARPRRPRRPLAAAGIAPLERGESLTVADFTRIAEALAERPRMTLSIQPDAAALGHRARAGQDQPPPRGRPPARGRLPPARHGLPGRRALRRRAGHRRSTAP